MKEGMTRRSVLEMGGLAAASFVLAGLPSGSGAGNSLDVRSGQSETDERLKWIKEVWKVPSTGHVGIEGWNESGLWSFYYDLSTGQVASGFFFDYRDTPFMKYDGYEPKTLAQLRAEGVPWEEIDRLHYEGFSRNPGYRDLDV